MQVCVCLLLAHPFCWPPLVVELSAEQ